MITILALSTRALPTQVTQSPNLRPFGGTAFMETHSQVTSEDTHKCSLLLSQIDIQLHSSRESMQDIIRMTGSGIRLLSLHHSFVM